MFKEPLNTDTLYHLNYSPPCGDSSKKSPSKKHLSSRCDPSLSPFPCWNLQLVPFLPWPCLRSSLEVLEWAERGPWSCLGSCAAPALMHGWELLHGSCAAPQLSWHLGFAWEVQGLSSMAGISAGRGSSLPHSRRFGGGFLHRECTVGLVLSLLFKAGVVEGLCCACWSPALFLRGALGTMLSFGACCFAALLMVDLEASWCCPGDGLDFKHFGTF